MVGVSKHYLGDLNGAQHHIERLLNRAAVPEDRSHITRFQFDQRIAARCFLALILFLRGFPDQAMGLATRNVDEALATNHAISLTYALANGACPVALFISDLAAVEYFVELLLERTARHQLHVWHVLGEYFKGVLLVSRGETGAGITFFKRALESFRKQAFAPQYTYALADLAAAMIHTGEIGEGLLRINEALGLVERTEERWCASELLRVKGDLVLLEGKPHAQRAAEE
jgi:hypothetical protein